jgi:VanZ family protein
MSARPRPHTARTRRTSPSLREPTPARFLLAVYVLLVVYATLYPLAGWRDPGGSAFAFLGAPWPRYVTAFDVAANFFGYVPYGLLCALVLRPRVPPIAAALAALLSGMALSVVLEAGQSFLPARIPSNLDIAANVAGAACGGIAGAWFVARLVAGGPLSRLRDAALTPGPAADLALALLGLWLFAQLNPATQLFGAGDVRELISAPSIPGERHPPELFVSVEAAIASANLVAVALIASAVIRPRAPVLRLMAGLLAAALGVKTLALAILMREEHALAWLTPGAQQGLAAGIAVALLTLRLPRTARLVLAAMLLMAATVLVNLAPPNPYFAETLKVWAQGHFLNFNGLTRLVSAAWPFAALGYLVYLATAMRREPLR